jgi:hypothetical protein
MRQRWHRSAWWFASKNNKPNSPAFPDTSFFSGVTGVADFQSTADSISNRVSTAEGEGYGLDPLTIATIVTTILPGILKCFQKDHEVPTVAAHDRIKRMYARNPERTRNKLARSVKFGTAKAGYHTTTDQNMAIADGMIAEALAADSEVVYGLCAASL